MFGNLQIVTMLLEAGGNTTLRDGHGSTPEDVADKYGFRGIVSMCSRADISKFKRERQIKQSCDKEDRKNCNGIIADDYKEANGSSNDINHITQVISRRRLERQESRRKQIEKEQQFQEEVDLAKSLYEESIWALTLELNVAEETGDILKAKFCRSRIQEEEKKKENVYHEKQAEWIQKERKEKEFEELLNGRKRLRRKLEESNKNCIESVVAETKGYIYEEIVKDNICNAITEQKEYRHNDDKDSKMPDKIIVSDDTEIPRQSPSSTTTFTKVFVVSLITGMLIHYVLME